MNQQELHGLWAAMPWPWDAGGKLDERALRVNLESYAGVPVDGTYITDSDGEFYAIELPEFEQLVGAFARHGRETGLSLQAGVTWSNTQGIIDRIRVCVDNGIRMVHVAFPYWMPIRRDEMKRFWEQLAKAEPTAQWIHYNTARSHLTLRGEDYEWVASNYPEQLIGTKLVSQSPYDLADCIQRTPHIAHFVTDFAAVTGYMAGARGCYSFWVNTLPRWTRELIDVCTEKDWERARVMLNKFLEWETRYMDPVFREGYLHGIIGKARAGLSGFLEDEGVTRAPYDPVPQETRARLQEAFDAFWKHEIEVERDRAGGPR